eukprot:s833_g13.t1
MHHVSPVPLPFKHDGDETKPLTEDANCIDALGRIEGRMGELLACMTELAGNLKEPSDAASDAASDAERSGGAKLPAALPAALPAQPCCRTWHRAMSRKRMHRAQRRSSKRRPRRNPARLRPKRRQGKISIRILGGTCL